MTKETEFNLSNKRVSQVNGYDEDNNAIFEYFYYQEDVREFIKRQIDKKQKQIDIFMEINSAESITQAELLEEELNDFKKDAGDKLT